MQRLRLIAGIAASLVSMPLVAQDQPQVITVPISDPEAPVTIEISILSARIEVVGEDRDDAEFSFTVTGGQRQIITPSGPKPLRGGGYELEIEEDDNVISVDTDWRADTVTLGAKVPRLANLYLDTVNEGEIVVSDITGSLHLENTNGPITATNIRGSVIAESVNDDISVSLVDIGADSATALESLNGDLRLSIPENAGVRVHLDTGSGEIYSDFEVEVRPSEPTIVRDDDGEGIEVRVESVIIADINGGGPVMRLKTLNGNIQIDKSTP